MSIRVWPALADAPPWWDLDLPYERGVLGKAHQQPTDYRWLAQTPGFRPDLLGWESRVAWGSQDQPKPVCSWVPGPDLSYAARGYASRAVDSAGRPGGVEKQFASIAPTGIPAPILAFLLLTTAERWDESVWWGQWADPRWAQRDFVLALPEEPRLRLRTPELAPALGDAVRLLLQSTNERDLHRFYAELFSGLRPAVIASHVAPFPAAALAALLLPLPPKMAGTVSLTSGIPSRYASLERLEAWSVVVWPEPAPSRQLSADSAGLASIAVESLHRGMEALSQARGAWDMPGPVPPDLPQWARSAARVMLEDDRTFPLDAAVRPLTGACLDYVNACARYYFGTFPCESLYRPSGNELRWEHRMRHREVLASIMRALLLAACPEPGIWQKHGRDFSSPVVPALLFLAKLPPEDWPVLARCLDGGTLSELARQSVAADYPGLPPDAIVEWLQRVSGGPDGSG